MSPRTLRSFVPLLALLLGSSVARVAPAQDPPDSPPPALLMARAVLEHVTAPDADDRAFVTTRLSPELRTREGDDVLTQRLSAVRVATGGRLPDDVIPLTPEELVLVFPGPSGPVRVHVLAQAPGPTLTDLWVEGGPGLDLTRDHSAPEPLAPIGWDTLDARLAEEAGSWYSGVVLVRRDGETVLHAGYGLANRETDLPNRPDTILAVGSIPIDFTKVAILLLAQRGELSLDDTLGTFFEGVPADKQGITVGHLMTGASGLPDFFDLPSDPNPDHTWIDRDEALRRLFAQELLFEPGTGDEHSHGAFVLLAAIVEVVSDTSYQAFTREHIFEPAGMPDTGFFGEPLPEGRFAMGYGSDTSGEVNAPPWWGQTSWLVMGSGGMVSTAGDLLAFQEALRAGKLLEPQWAARYWAPPGAVSSNGDMFGFEAFYTEDPGNQIFLMSNSTTPQNQPRLEELMFLLIRMTRGG